MKSPLPRRLTLTATALLLTACSSVPVEQTLDRVQNEVDAFARGRVSLARNADDQAARARVSADLLASPLALAQASELALANSPTIQTLIALGWAETADAAQFGRIANPVFSYERLLAGGDLELSRALSFGLLDLLTLPARQGIAEHRVEQARLRLAGEVIDQITRVRQAWVRAVAARQTLAYARQALDSAEASAELARRMQAAGNFNRLASAREQAFRADAATRLAQATHQATASREELVRALGLDQTQAERLQLPERLPELPAQARDPQAFMQVASRTRLDIRLAQSSLAAAGQAQGLNTVTSFTDIELGVRDKRSISGTSRQDLQGLDVAFRLPVFDWGELKRDAWNARTLAAANQLESTMRTAGSSLRETWSAYRSAHDIARHYRDEVVPLRKVISAENQLRYNAMLIGVFELLADAREQIGAVMAAINAEQQFWLAEVALQAALIGRPVATLTVGPIPVLTTGAAGPGAGH
jgi:outer membrane protein TolC